MRRWTAALLAAHAGIAAAQAPAPVPVDSLVVTATRNLERGAEVPASHDRIDAATIRDGQPLVNLSETLVRIPGLVANNRQNYAQDLQVSSRGFGARAPFGVRGVRLYQDGIPATMPDGQGQTGSFSLLSAGAIEVLRGPFSALYGNASGGVVAVFSEPGRSPPSVEASAGAGSHGMRTAGLKANGATDTLGYVVAASRFRTDGYREHSAATRHLVNAKLGLAPAAGTRVTVIASHQDQPGSQDPLGLTRSRWESDPRQVDPLALQFDTRKSIRQTQGGVDLEHRLSPELTLKLLGHSGTRVVRQYLAFAGTGATSSGGVVDLDRRFEGLDARLVWRRALGEGSLTAAVGAESGRQRERRRGFVNDGGALGDLRRDEDDTVRATDGYAQVDWTVFPALTLLAGVRVSSIAFRSNDRYVTAANPDDSGSRDFRHASPVAGAVWRLAENVHAYASHGEGFETPTFAELAYRPGGPGLNLALDAATSKANEAGVRIEFSPGHRLAVAAFATDTKDEIVVNAATGGRTTYRNAGQTRRRGFEVQWQRDWGGGIATYVSYARLRARFAQDFTSGTPPVSVPAGTPLPGVPPATAFAELSWRPGGWGGFSVALDAQHSGRVTVNEQASDAAPAWTIVNARIGFEQKVGGIRLRGFVRADNLADRRYAGSVIVGDTNGRYFEPAPGRGWFAGISAEAAY
ncbi:MAG: TonB-dependent receptor family protein [Burkholderiales bacterium]